MRTVEVDLGAASYPIYIGSGLINGDLCQQHIAGNSCMLISNTTIAPLYAETLNQHLEIEKSSQCLLEDGEQYKNLDSLKHIISTLLEQRFDRNTTLIALGGGVVGDICGFAAASFQRGVNFIQVPTTLLAMVDSSVGGKTAVNHEMGKNMIGAFHQPQCVVIDIDTLTTLEEREYRAGLAEVIKYGLIIDAEFFAWLESNIQALINRDAETLIYAIERSCAIKADVVSQDEKEQGIRALLNLGHTFGHAIETGLGYGQWLHGEAISTGMILAARLSEMLGLLKQSDVERTVKLFEQTGLPTHVPDAMTAQRFTELMAVDKKVKNGVLRLILMEAIGKAIIKDDVSPDQIKTVIETHTG